MVKELGGNVAIVSSSELGTDCWSSFRFIRGYRCPRVMECNYPGKKTCRAVDAEIKHLNEELIDHQGRVAEKIAKLIAVKER